jgi:hypothetical protein
MVEFVRNGKSLIGAHRATVTFKITRQFGEMPGAFRAVRGIVAVLKVEDGPIPRRRC